MPSMFDQAFETNAAPLFGQWFGTTVSLQRHPFTTDSFQADWALQEYRSFDENLGIPIVVKKRVYRFLKTDATMNGATFEPHQGDVLVDGSDSMTLLPIDGKPAVESEPGDYRWLVRTNKLA